MGFKKQGEKKQGHCYIGYIKDAFLFCTGFLQILKKIFTNSALFTNKILPQMISNMRDDQY